MSRSYIFAISSTDFPLAKELCNSSVSNFCTSLEITLLSLPTTFPISSCVHPRHDRRITKTLAIRQYPSQASYVAATFPTVGGLAHCGSVVANGQKTTFRISGTEIRDETMLLTFSELSATIRDRLKSKAILYLG